MFLEFLVTFIHTITPSLYGYSLIISVYNHFKSSHCFLQITSAVHQQDFPSVIFLALVAGFLTFQPTSTTQQRYFHQIVDGHGCISVGPIGM